MEALLNEFFNLKVKVIVEDGRILFGIIKSVDIRGNLILNEVIVELPEHKVSFLNKQIEYMFDFTENKAQALKCYFGANETMTPQSIERLWENRYYISGFVVPFWIIHSILIMN